MGENLKDYVGMRKVGTTLEFDFIKSIDVLEADNLAAGRKPFQRLTDDRTGRVDIETVGLTQSDIYTPSGNLKPLPAQMAAMRLKMRSASQVDHGDGQGPRDFPRFKLNFRQRGPNDAEFVPGDTPAAGNWPGEQ